MGGDAGRPQILLPITSHPPAEPAAQTGFRRAPLRHWTPVGPNEFVTMDSGQPYVGEHTPLVKLSQTQAHGIQQVGLVARKGKSYMGRVILAGDPGASVKVTLTWGDAASERQTVVIGKLGPDYVKFHSKRVGLTSLIRRIPSSA